VTRFLAILAAIALLWLALEAGLRKLRRSPAGRQISFLWRALSNSGGSATPPTAARPAKADPTALVRCSVCSVHVAEERSIRRAVGAGEAVVFCSEACAEAASHRG